MEVDHSVMLTHSIYDVLEIGPNFSVPGPGSILSVRVGCVAKTQVMAQPLECFQEGGFPKGSNRNHYEGYGK